MTILQNIFKSYIQEWNVWGHDEMGAPLPNGEIAIHAHNTFLQVIPDHGLVFGIYFIAFMLYFMRIVMVEEGVQQALNKSVREVAAATTNYSDHSGVATTSAAIAKTHLHLSGDPFVEKFVVKRLN